MKKLLKCFISIVLVISVVLCFTCTSFAASTSWGTNFPVVQKGTSSMYNYAIQSILYRYNLSTRAYIINSGGIDGDFGSGTYNAVVTYQGLKNLTIDGVVGSATWDSLYGTLSYYYYIEPHTYYRISNGSVLYDEVAISRYSLAELGAVVTGWYAYKSLGDAYRFSSY